MGTVKAAVEVARAIDNINTGYDQSQRLSFINIAKRQLIPNKEADCSTVCGGIAYLAGYLPTLPTDFYTGNARRYLKQAGFTVRKYKSLADLRKGEFVLNEGNHIEFMADDNTMFSANIDEHGKAHGGKAGDQTSREVCFKPKFVYRLGWDYVLTPPKDKLPVPAWSIAKDYNPANFSSTYIKNIQTLLKAKGYDIGPAGIDGDLGPSTFAAIEKFQSNNGLVKDGIPGPKTLAALEKKENSVAKSYIVVQGVKMTPGTNYYYQKLRAAFRKATGLDLLLTSGYRTYAEQKSLYDRWKAGTFHSPSVARPGTSLHESGRALDLRDSGTTAGVTVAGNSRSNWMKANAPKYGFNATGYNFREPWHFELQSHLNPWKVPSGAPAPSVVSPTINDGFSNAYIKDIQRRLKRLGYSIGSAGIDGSLGSATKAATKKFQSAFGLVKDGLPGPKTLRKLKIVELQKAVRAKQDGLFGPDTNKRVNAVKQSSAWGGKKFPYGVKYTQKVVGTTDDGSWGQKSVLAHDKTVTNIQQAIGVNQDGIWGPNTDRAVNALK